MDNNNEDVALHNNCLMIIKTFYKQISSAGPLGKSNLYETKDEQINRMEKEQGERKLATDVFKVLINLQSMKS